MLLATSFSRKVEFGINQCPVRLESQASNPFLARVGLNRPRVHSLVFELAYFMYIVIIRIKKHLDCVMYYLYGYQEGEKAGWSDKRKGEGSH